MFGGLCSASSVAEYILSHAGGFIKTVIRILRCVGHYNSKLLIDKV